MGNAAKIIPVILSGGSGMRLWPLSRLGRPKQFLALAGEHSLLQQTALRVVDLGAPLVVAAAAQGEAVEAQLAEAGTPPSLLILEPAARNTAPAIALAALASEPEDLLLVLPSDHLVKDEAAFHAAVETARPAAEEGWLVTFGIAPSRPETGYGYIRTGHPIGGGAFQVEAFVEKPDLATAQAYLVGRRHLWNSGMFLFRAAAYLQALREHAPYLLPAVEAAIAGGARHGARLVPEAQAFARAPSQSVDHAVMERHARVAVVPAEMGWSDIGSWEALHDVLGKDEADNVLTGDIVAIDSKGSLIRSDGPVVAAIGVEDMIVVATERSVLIVPRGQSQRVQEAVEALIRRGAPPPELLRE
jgi:mannose-1-phosphate guanylyltransferase/mannose-1-phosphate guanylyltransferase/mannose-6-phosphate isomerase